jgi:3-phenylpropionate/trans-cinnamate dioxygenase ferredoxin reductase subunit
VVEAAARPLAERFPEVVGERIQALHAAHGVDLRCGVALTGLRGAGRVEAVELSDGSILAADVVVVAVGSLPNTGWLAGSGLAVDGGVGCDLAGATAIENVVVTGDAARVHDPTSGGSTRHEHWHFAQSHPAIAVEYLLHRRRPPALEPLYVWSDQHGHRIQLVGNWRLPAGAVTSTDEDADGLTIAVRHRGRLVAALVIDRPREFARLRRELRGVAGPNVEAAAR